MDRHDRTRAWGDSSLDSCRIELIRVGIDIGEDRRCTHGADRFGCRVKGIGRADHFVAGADVVGAQGEDQGIGTVRNTDRVRNTNICSRLGLEGLDVGTEDKDAAANHLIDSSQNTVVERLPLAAQIHQWYAHVRQDTAPIGMGR